MSDEQRHQLELVVHYLGHLRSSTTMKPAGYALLAQHKLQQQAKRITELEDTLRYIRQLAQDDIDCGLAGVYTLEIVQEADKLLGQHPPASHQR